MSDHLTATAKQADLLRQKILDVVDAHKKGSMDLCQAIYESDSTVVKIDGDYVPVWKVWGFKTWEDYIGKEVGMHITTAYCYRKVYSVFYDKLAGAWDTDLLLPVTKMKLLSSAKLTKGNVNKWLKKAAGMTCRELAAAVYETEELRSLSLSVTNAQLKRANKCFDEARSLYTKGEEMTRGELLIQMLNEWHTMKNPKKGLRIVKGKAA